MADALEPRIVLNRIIGVLGLTSLVGTGCAPRTIAGGGEQGAAETSSSESGDPGSDTSDGDGSSDDESESDSGDEMPPDLGGGPPVCEEFEFLDHDAEESLGFVIPVECDTDWGSDPVCFYPPQGTTCAAEAVTELCLLENYRCGLSRMGQSVTCGPFTVDDACCYVVAGDCPIGRPFMVAGVARLAPLRSDPDWSSARAPDLRALDAATKAALADAYAQEGLREHASVASFARFTMQLQAVGAAPHLIAVSLRAGQDELRHAQRCFGLASAYAGRPLGPGPLDVRAALDDCELETIALSLASEGCIAETISMLLLAAARDRARDPAVRACLSETVAEELEHVLLAWEALAALLRAHPQLRDPLARVFAQADQHVGFGPITKLPGDPASMRAHGYLQVDERRTIALDALARVVRPAARALLTTQTTQQAAHHVLA